MGPVRQELKKETREERARGKQGVQAWGSSGSNITCYTTAREWLEWVGMDAMAQGGCSGSGRQRGMSDSTGDMTYRPSSARRKSDRT